MVTLRGNQLNGQFGTSCVIPGDVNNDGFDDLVVGAPYQGVGEVLEGIVYLYLGSPTGIHAPAAQTIQIDVAFANFGRNVARLGDVNHDGYADLVVGAPEFMNGEAAEGEVLAYFGSPAGFVTPASWTLEGNETNLELGLNGLGGGGDYNNDGNGDLIVGWPQSDSGANDGGRVTVYTSTPTSFQPTPILDVPTPGVGSLLGAAVGGMADFNGDGTTDLYYSAPGYGLAEQYEGIVKVRLGNLVGDWNADWPLAAWRTDGTAPIADGTRSNSTTGFNLHATGRSAAGRTRLKLEWEVKPLGAGFDFTGRGTSAWQTTSGASPGVGSKTTFNAAVTGLTPATRYHWRARYRSASPLFPWSPWFGPERITRNERMLSTGGGALPVGVDPAIPDASVLALAGAAPNPFTGSAALAFTLPRAGHAVLALYDVSGRLVKTVFDDVAPAGRTATAWDGRHADGRVAAAGAYFTRLTFEGEERIGKVVRLR